jgi:antitoxin HigA-1
MIIERTKLPHDLKIMPDGSRNDTVYHFDHAGEVLQRQFISFNKLAQGYLARAIGISQARISELVTGTKRFNADLDLRLCKFFGLPNGSFLDTQTQFDLKKKYFEIEDELNKIIPLRKLKE